MATLIFCFIVLVLTLLTQIGGIVLWFVWPTLAAVRARWNLQSRVMAATAGTVLFSAAYLVVTVLVMPALAGAYGRVPLPCLAGEPSLRAHSPLYCLLNRHYVRADLARLLTEVATEITAAFPNTDVRYFDAGFPLFDSFPLLPHLSHRNGRAVDLAFHYRDSASGDPVPPPSVVGYWAYTPPITREPQPCREANSLLRWDFDWIQPLFARAILDSVRTRALFKRLLDRAERFRIGKILVEPHLKQRLGLVSELVRFQGCNAARHDDHLHLQLR